MLFFALSLLLVTGNATAKMVAGDIHDITHFVHTLIVGFFTSAILTAFFYALFLIPGFNSIFAVLLWCQFFVIVLGVMMVIMQYLVFNRVGVMVNGFRVMIGLFYTDTNKTVMGQIIQLTSRFTWESIQSFIGFNYTFWRNSLALIDKVAFFGGTTYAASCNSSCRNGVSIGNYINVNMWDHRLAFLSDPLLLHEYGHTFQSLFYGPSYLLVVGMPSLWSASLKCSRVPGTFFTSHDLRWYERQANRQAARYIHQHYGLDWSMFEDMYPRFYPKKNKF